MFACYQAVGTELVLKECLDIIESTLLRSWEHSFSTLGCMPSPPGSLLTSSFFSCSSTSDGQKAFCGRPYGLLVGFGSSGWSEGVQRPLKTENRVFKQLTILSGSVMFDPEWSVILYYSALWSGSLLGAIDFRSFECLVCFFLFGKQFSLFLAFSGDVLVPVGALFPGVQVS